MHDDDPWFKNIPNGSKVIFVQDGLTQMSHIHQNPTQETFLFISSFKNSRLKCGLSPLDLTVHL